MPENPAPVSTSTEFQIVYNGPALESGTMDVRDLAPALLALSSLVDQINARVNGADKPIAMKFKSTSKGSLIADLQLATTWVQEAIGFFSSGKADQLRTIMDTLWGGGITTGVAGIFYLIKFLKGRPAARVEPGPTSTTINVFNIQGDYITTSVATFELAQEPRTLLEAGKVVKPLEKEGVDSFAIMSSGEKPETMITKDDLPAFLPEKAQQPAENISVTLLQLVQVDVTEANAKWRFTDGNGRFYAVIKDEDFMARFLNREFTVGHNDALRVELVRRQTIVNGKIKTDNEIRRVLNYYSGGVPPVQGKLLL
jgi:hypothetical protein